MRAAYIMPRLRTTNSYDSCVSNVYECCVDVDRRRVSRTRGNWWLVARRCDRLTHPPQLGSLAAGREKIFSRSDPGSPQPSTAHTLTIQGHCSTLIQLYIVVMRWWWDDVLNIINTTPMQIIKSELGHPDMYKLDNLDSFQSIKWLPTRNHFSYW